MEYQNQAEKMENDSIEKHQQEITMFEQEV
jgi:hypothetical protein